MADWRKLAQATFVADGVSKLKEKIKQLKKEILADGKIDLDEIRFLADLRALIQKRAKAKKLRIDPAFDEFYFKLFYDSLLEDGKIDDGEAGWLRELIFADGRVDAAEQAFLAKV